MQFRVYSVEKSTKDTCNLFKQSPIKNMSMNNTTTIGEPNHAKYLGYVDILLSCCRHECELTEKRNHALVFNVNISGNQTRVFNANKSLNKPLAFNVTKKQ